MVNVKCFWLKVLRNTCHGAIMILELQKTLSTLGDMREKVKQTLVRDQVNRPGVVFLFDGS